MRHARPLGSLAVLCALCPLLPFALEPAAAGSANAAGRIVAIGDLHGDATTFRAVLAQAGLVDGQGRWSGGQTTLVQMGDVFDRGTEVRSLLDILMALESEAAAAGGQVVALLGNHEAMNLLGELRDAAPAAVRDFADAQSETRREKAYDAYVELARQRRAALARTDPPLQAPELYAAPDRDRWMAAHPPGTIEYLEAIAPSGPYGAWLRQRPATVRIAGTVFVHGGFNPDTTPRTLDAVNDQVAKEIQRFDRMRKYMLDRKLALPWFTLLELLEAGRTELARVAAEARAQGEPPPAPGALPPAVVRHPLAGLLDIDSWALLNADGPLWFRGFAHWTDAQGSEAIGPLLRRFGAERFVVGHTITSTFRITPRFDDRVFLIDTGISSVYRASGGQPSALEIQQGAVTAIYASERVPLVPAAALR